jgi:hypothetical protein
MAATIRLSDTIEFCKPYVNWANLTIGVANEPAVTAANLTIQTIIGPPFVWPWNRNTTSFLTTPGIQDYNAAISDFGFLESVSIQAAAVITSVTVSANVAVFQAVNNFSAIKNFVSGSTQVTISGCTTSALNGTFSIASATATTFTVNITTGNIVEAESGAKALAGPIMPVEVVWGSQGEATEQDRPAFISTQSSDESGTTFKFRFLPVPDETYQVILTYQQVPKIFSIGAPTSLTWGIPDQLQYIYTYFFLFFMLDYFEDARAARYRQLAVAALLARQSGLSETDRNLFLGNWLPLMKQEISAQESTQQGNQGRGL